MAETLLSFSNILLFGREMEDLRITLPEAPATERVRHASTTNINIAAWPTSIDGVVVRNGKRILLKDQTTASENGVYSKQDAVFTKYEPDYDPYFVRVGSGTVNAGKMFQVTSAGAITAFVGDDRHGPFAQPRAGLPGQTEGQLLASRDPRLARIYAFSFEGYYYELPRPIVFLVHGGGIPASEAKMGGNGKPRPARAPGDPSLTGLGAADFQFADELMVWSYDKADYTIRMDVETGMFEDVLLEAVVGSGSGGMDAAGMSARGMSARGMSARGMSARGMSARGSRGGNNND
ncbi:hypothetical protein [Mesorhizobium sp. LNHC221B00]|uniref:hypothetical protein n=1 Tax=Mesorhizobium sp. LNHC221B00 TaxID=1287233 RepID=UPI0012EC9D39|nr:hypothetical protein [Mesorhizobium sp. LNHC221B00]